MASHMMPTDPEVLEPFSITIVDEWETEGGVGWSGDVSSPSGASFGVENDGVGEDNRYLSYDPASQALLAVFREASETAYPDSEWPMDMACLWLEVRDLTN